MLRATNCSFLKNFLTGSKSSGGQLWMRTSSEETSEVTGTVSYVTNCTFYSEITFFGDASLVVEHMYNSIISWNYATGTHRNSIMAAKDTKYTTLEWNVCVSSSFLLLPLLGLHPLLVAHSCSTSPKERQRK